MCDRKLHYPAEEPDDEENREKTKTKKMKKKDEEKEKENGKETKKGVLQYRRELQHFAIYKHRPWPILKFEVLMSSQMFSDYFSSFSNY